MSKELVEFASQFVAGKMDVETFNSEFIDRWKQEGADGRILRDAPEVSEMLSTIFCFADLYNPDSNREDYEFDEATLRNKVQNILRL